MPIKYNFKGIRVSVYLPKFTCKRAVFVTHNCNNLRNICINSHTWWILSKSVTDGQLLVFFLCTANTSVCTFIISHLDQCPSLLVNLPTSLFCLKSLENSSQNNHFKTSSITSPFYRGLSSDSSSFSGENVKDCPMEWGALTRSVPPPFTFPNEFHTSLSCIYSTSHCCWAPQVHCSLKSLYSFQMGCNPWDLAWLPCSALSSFNAHAFPVTQE